MPSVTRKSHTTRTARRAELRARLLEVVERLLATGESFTEMSVERLVSEAGLSRSTFYVYFEDKGDLLSEWLGDIINQVAESSQQWYSLSTDATREDLRSALAHVVETYAPHTTLMAAVLDASTYDPSVREGVADMMNRNVAGLRHHIKEGQKAGFIDPKLLPQETAEWLAWMAERGLHQLIREAKGKELERLVDAYTDIVWNTLYAPVLERRKPKRAGARSSTRAA
jgi:TetR/AcrR family transcriptional regulator, ethionamide resistance regulator